MARAHTQSNTIRSPNAILILSVQLTSKQKKCLSVYMDAPEKQSYRGGCPGSITTERTPDAIITCEVSGRENIRAGEVNEVAGSTPVHYLRQRDLARGHSIRDRRTPDQTIFGGERGTELGERSHQADARLLFEQLICYSTASRSLPRRTLFDLAHNGRAASPYAHFMQHSHPSIVTFRS